MKNRPSLLPFLFCVLLFFGPPVRGQDQKPVKPDEDRALRLKKLESEVRGYLEAVLSEDTVDRGNALEAIARVGEDLKDLEIEDLVSKVRESGITARQRFVAVLAGTILARLDPAGTVPWLKAKAFGANARPLVRRMGLAILSEIPTKEAGRLAASMVGAGPAETRVQALLALAKLRRPETYGALVSALGARDKEVKDNAAIALGRLKDPRAIPSLLAHLDDATGDHPCFAAWALKQFDDPGGKIFDAVAERLQSDSGQPGDAKARIIESMAIARHVPRLRGILTGSRSTKYRYAAALALGRLAEGDFETQKVLLQRLMRDGDRRVRAACFFGLSRNASKALSGEIVKGLKRTAGSRRTDQARVFRWLAFLAGDLHIPEAGPVLLTSARLQKIELSWRIAAVNFWRCADRASIDKLVKDFDKATDERQIARMAEILGRSKQVREFRYLVRQLRRFRAGSADSFAVELALEQMTGHFFGPDYGIWRHWFDKNPEFFTPKRYRIDRRRWQREFGRKEREYRQTPLTERAVQLGLAWLSRHQSLEGSIDPNRFFDRCSIQPSCIREGSRHMLDPLGTTSLAALAFLGGGYSPEKGKFKDTLRRFLEYIEIRQTADGNYTTTDRFQGYNRPIAIYSLAEAFNITADDRYREYLRRGINYLVEIQNELGGWHYQAASRQTDTSVMSWVLLGLSMAKRSGFWVRESVFEGCDMILDACSEQVTKEREVFLDLDPHYAYDVGKKFTAEYQTGYQSKVSENATTCFGLMARMVMGWPRSHPFCIGSANFILAHNMEEIPKGEKWSKYVSKKRFPSYAWYYGTLAMHQMGGRFFRAWNAVIKKLLPGIQLTRGCDLGAWPVLNYDFVGGKVYSSCMGVLTLETYYRYKPFCEEGLPEEDDE